MSGMLGHLEHVETNVLTLVIRRTEEKLKTVVESHGKGIEGEIIPLVGDVTKKDSVEYVV